ncbi:hypothetical protein [Chryseobacterium piperi]|nr:hypothetical protein [Chryseobacterium piperi]
MNKKLFLMSISVAFLFAFDKVNAQDSAMLVEEYYKKSGQLAQRNNS